MQTDDIRVRWVAARDAAELERFYAALSSDSRALRFQHACRGISDSQAECFATADHHLRDGFVAVSGDRIVGHLVLEPAEDATEELAIAVDDRLQHHGVGTLLLAAAMASARLRGVDCLVAWVLPDNRPMRRLLAAARHPMRMRWEDSVLRYELDVKRTATPPVAA
jgi:RimJ/RimL family protein N-acetyltransferase